MVAKEPRLHASRSQDDEAYVAAGQIRKQRSPLIDVRAIVTAVLLALPMTAFSVAGAWFTMTAKMEASTRELQRAEKDIADLKLADAELRKVDNERSVRDAETVERLAGVVKDVDRLVTKIEELEERRR